MEWPEEIGGCGDVRLQEKLLPGNRKAPIMLLDQEINAGGTSLLFN